MPATLALAEGGNSTNSVIGPSRLVAPQAALFGANKGLRDLVSMLWESGLRAPHPGAVVHYVF